ncbi:MAG: hypothetical protein U0V72_04310 [Cytophagales bacterium]
MKFPNFQISKFPNNIWKESFKILLAFTGMCSSTATAQTWNTGTTGNYTQGNLGVGTTTVPTNEKLRVEGKIYGQSLQLGTSSTPNYFLGTAGTTGDVTLINPANSLWSMNGSSLNANSFLGSLSGNTNPLKINTNGLTRMYISGINSNIGNVSVGSTASRNPYYWKFEVNAGRTALIGPDNSNGTYDQTNILQIVSNWNPSSTSSQPVFTTSGTVMHYMSLQHERFSNNEEHGVINCYQFKQPSGPGAAKQLILQKSGGNVGIGSFTSAPTAKLEVQGGDIKTSGDVIFDGNKSVRSLLASGGTSQWTTSGSNIYYNSGKVGIGTTTPKQDLQVTNKVLIGTTEPNNYLSSYKLAVDGKIVAKSLNITPTWADYVFENDYKLKPLDSVQIYIKQFKHLPEIPSGLEVEQKGIDAGEMLRLQMLKIEELTLYLIDQNKKINLLEAEINSLKYKK